MLQRIKILHQNELKKKQKRGSTLLFFGKFFFISWELPISRKCTSRVFTVYTPAAWQNRWHYDNVKPADCSWFYETFRNKPAWLLCSLHVAATQYNV